MYPFFSKLRASIPLALAALAAAPAALAHHSFAMFDDKQTLTMQCTVKELMWSNPHTWLDLLPQDPNAHVKTLSLELNGTSGLRHQGWKPTTLKPGDKVTVVYHPMRDGTPAGELLEVTTPDGQKLKGR